MNRRQVKKAPSPSNEGKRKGKDKKGKYDWKKEAPPAGKPHTLTSGLTTERRIIGAPITRHGLFTAKTNAPSQTILSPRSPTTQKMKTAIRTEVILG
jgi:hypothetical protein